MNTANNKKGILYKEKLKKCLLGLMEKGVEIDRISVKAICEAADVNRSTFYSHYAVPRDILLEIEEETLASISGYMRKMVSLDFDYLTAFLEYIKGHDDVFRILFLYAKDKPFLERLTQEALFHFDDVKVWFKNKNDYTYVKTFITSGSRDVINAWIQRDYAEDVEYIKRLILTVNEAAIKAFT